MWNIGKECKMQRVPLLCRLGQTYILGTPTNGFFAALREITLGFPLGHTEQRCALALRDQLRASLTPPP